MSDRRCAIAIPVELKAAIDRIPLKERRIAWSKAIYNTFSKEELDESRRRSEFGTRMLEKRALTERPWVAGKTYSLGDVNGFNLGYALPLARPDVCNDEKTPHIMEWLRKIYERPATKATWAMGRTQMAARVELSRAQAGKCWGEAPCLSFITGSRTPLCSSVSWL